MILLYLELLPKTLGVFGLMERSVLNIVTSLLITARLAAANDNMFGLSEWNENVLIKYELIDLAKWHLPTAIPQ